MADVGMDIAVGQQAQQVQGPLVRAAVVHQRLPGGRTEQRAGLDALIHQPRALRKDLPAAEGVVADLGVAHVSVGGQAHGGAMGLERHMGTGGQQVVEVGGAGVKDRVAGVVLSDATAVENDKYDWFPLQCSSTQWAAKGARAGRISPMRVPPAKTDCAQLRPAWCRAAARSAYDIVRFCCKICPYFTIEIRIRQWPCYTIVTWYLRIQ